MVPPKDSLSLAQKIIKVFDDKGKIEKMGQYSAYLSKNKYSWSSVALKTKKVYQRLLA